MPLVHRILLGTLLMTLATASLRADGPILSHPPTRPLPALAQRPLLQGPAYFVDPLRGSDQADGSRQQPWRTIQHALEHLSPGDTLLLRGGTYFERVYCAIAGTRDKPITIRAYPGERVILDGSLPEFQQAPHSAWLPAPEGGGEFISAQTYKNLRDVVGLFGDSNLGLQTYWHRMDLQATNELWIPNEDTMVEPVYCGPGLWYEKMTGRIHARLAHTHIENDQVANYRGETDPRKLPLVVAPFDASPLFLDQAMNVVFQDLVIRGGGHDVVKIRFGINITFENVAIYGGTYGLRTISTGPFRFVHSAIHGMMAPWMFRTENVLRTYTSDYYDPFLREFTEDSENLQRRHIARLPSHALLVTEDGNEFDVFRYPFNHDWTIAHSEFTDAHDGVYLSGQNIHFHHNWVDNIQDDALYLSPPNPNVNRGLYVHQNLITRSLLGFGYHMRGGPAGDTFVFRNIVDFRQGINDVRPTPENPQGKIHSYHVHLAHGRHLMGIENIRYYQNTFIAPANPRAGFLHMSWTNTTPLTERVILNNLFLYLGPYPAPRVTGHNLLIDGNLHWSASASAPENYLDTVRDSEGSRQSREAPRQVSRFNAQHRLETIDVPPYPHGWEAHSQVADPQVIAFGEDPQAPNDYRLGPDSPARGAGVPLPADLPDPLRPAENEARPDIGAIPADSQAPAFGRWQRIRFPLPGWIAAPVPQPEAAARVAPNVVLPAAP